MNIARIAVLGVAVAASGGAALTAKSLLGNQQVEVVQTEVKVKTVEVLVAKRDIGLGTTVTRGDIGWQEWPEENVTESYTTKATQSGALDDMVGAIARMPLIQGEPITGTKLVKAERGGFMSAILPAGKRAVSTKVSPETGAGGFILPNDRVDVILTRSVSNADDANASPVATDTILTNVRVLAVDQSLQEETGKQVAVGRTATLELDADQAEILAAAQISGEISLSLRSLADGADSQEQVVKRSKSIKVLKFGIASQVSAAR